MLEGFNYAQCGTIRLCYRVVSRGPTVVLLHGTTATLGVWDAVVELLGTRVRTVAVDQRGHGRSDKPATGYGAADYCTDLRLLLPQLSDAPVVVAGHSLGARNAVVLGCLAPEIVAGVVAIDYTPYIESEVLDELEVRVRGGGREFDSEDDVMGYLQQRYPLMPPEAVARRLAYGYHRIAGKLQPLANATAMAQTVDGLRKDFTDDVKSISVPVTFVRGALSAIVSEEAFASTRALRPDLRMVEVDSADHYLPEVAPAAVAEEIVHMLKGVG